MKVYEIKEEELRSLGYNRPIDRSMQLKGDNVKHVEKASEADIVVLPIPVRQHDCGDGNREHSLPESLLADIILKFGIPQERITAFDCSDFEAAYNNFNKTRFIRCNLKGWMRRQMPLSIPWFWPVEDFSDIAAIPEGGFKYDVSAHMWLSSNIRHAACNSVGGQHNLKADMVTRSEFYGYIERDEPARAKALKAAFKDSMRVSRVSLCPASIQHVFPYRFFEALSAARVPVLFCEDYCLPWEEEIPYREFCLMLNNDESHQAGPIIRNFLDKTPDEKLIEMGKTGRKYFERYLNRDRQSWLWAEALEKVLARDGMLGK